MKVVAYCTLHYGSDYLEAAIRSVIDAVDLFYVLYTPRGSFGHATDLPCPDSKTDLMKIAMKTAGRKLIWHEGQWGSEVSHRDAIYSLAPDADIYVIADADEVWSDGLAAAAVYTAQETGAKITKVPISHYWRSFYRAVILDAWPSVGRVINPKGEGEVLVDQPTETIPGQLNKIRQDRIHHMGYAQNSAIAYYKQFVHGHKPEWRWDWYETKWQPNAQADVHPVNFDFWNPAPVDPWKDLGMPEWMRQHPYANLEVIP